jgi:hypothetical protein
MEDPGGRSPPMPATAEGRGPLHGTWPPGPSPSGSDPCRRRHMARGSNRITGPQAGWRSRDATSSRSATPNSTSDDRTGPSLDPSRSASGTTMADGERGPAGGRRGSPDTPALTPTRAMTIREGSTPFAGGCAKRPPRPPIVGIATSDAQWGGDSPRGGRHSTHRTSTNKESGGSEGPPLSRAADESYWGPIFPNAPNHSMVRSSPSSREMGL